MTELRRKMIEDMKLHGFAEKTQAAYLCAVRSLAKYYMRAPDQLSEKEIREYFMWVVEVQKASPSTLCQKICGIKFLYEQTLGRAVSSRSPQNLQLRIFPGLKNPLS